VVTTLSRSEQTRLSAGLHAVCEHAGIDARDATLIKFTMNAVYRLDRAGVVVRLANGPGASARVTRVVQVANAFAALDIPTIQLAAGLEEAVHADGWSASIWDLLPQPDQQTWEPVDLTGPLRAIHTITELPVTLPAWDPVAKSRRRLADLDQLDDDQRQHLQRWATGVGPTVEEIVGRLNDWCDDLDKEVRHARWHLPVGVIHGDAHTGNLLLTSNGRTVLCDLDSVTVGPREWDLTPAAHGPQRFGRSRSRYQDFVDEYGVDVTTLPGWDILRQIRELQLLTSVIGSLDGRPAVAAELAHRLKTLLHADVASPWHRYE
jgi:hypothetical protein